MKKVTTEVLPTIQGSVSYPDQASVVSDDDDTTPHRGLLSVPFVEESAANFVSTICNLTDARSGAHVLSRTSYGVRSTVYCVLALSLLAGADGVLIELESCRFRGLW